MMPSAKDERFGDPPLERRRENRGTEDISGENDGLPWSQAFLGGGIHGATPGTFGIRAIPAFVLVGPDGKIVARGMRGDEIKKQVAKVAPQRAAELPGKMRIKITVKTSSHLGGTSEKAGGKPKSDLSPDLSRFPLSCPTT